MSEFSGLDLLQEKIHNLLELSSGFAAEKDRLTQEIDFLKSETGRLNGELTELRHQLEHYKGERDAVKERVDCLISMIDSIPPRT